MDAAVETYRSFRPSAHNVLRYYPKLGFVPVGNDPRVVGILQRYLKPPEFFKSAFLRKHDACCFRGCVKKHAIVVGLGERLTSTEFGKFSFECSREFRSPIYVTLETACQLAPAALAAIIFEIICLEPPAIQSSEGVTRNFESWKNLIPHGYKAPNKQVVAELTAAWTLSRTPQVTTVSPAALLAPMQPAPIPLKPACQHRSDRDTLEFSARKRFCSTTSGSTSQTKRRKLVRKTPDCDRICTDL